MSPAKDVVNIGYVFDDIMTQMLKSIGFARQHGTVFTASYTFTLIWITNALNTLSMHLCHQRLILTMPYPMDSYGLPHK